MGNSKDIDWEQLDWERKVKICMEGSAHEDSLLLTFLLIFIALEAMFFAAVFSVTLSFCLNLVVAVLAILVAVYFIYIFRRRGDYDDHWGAILYTLWEILNDTEISGSGVKASEIRNHYEGCKRRRGMNWHERVFGQGGPWALLKSPRLFITTTTPLLVILVWIFIIVNQVLNI